MKMPVTGYRVTTGMKQNSIEIFNLVARASKIHDEIFRLRGDVRELIRHEDYVLPNPCLDDLRYVEEPLLDDAEDAMADAIVSLCAAMRKEEEIDEEQQ